jgi:hypothetical protein
LVSSEWWVLNTESEGERPCFCCYVLFLGGFYYYSPPTTGHSSLTTHYSALITQHSLLATPHLPLPHNHDVIRRWRREQLRRIASRRDVHGGGFPGGSLHRPLWNSKAEVDVSAPRQNDHAADVPR